MFLIAKRKLIKGVVLRSINRAVFLVHFLSVATVYPNIKPIERVEPPFWWTHFKDRKLEILVYGDKIGDTKKVSVYNKFNQKEKTIQIKSVKKTDNNNYLFIELELDEDIAAGEYTFRLTGKKKNKFEYIFQDPVPDKDYANGFDASDVIYLLMPDRFSNGDSSNDRIEGMLSGTNRSSPGERHGGDFRGIRDRLKYLKDLGITGIWMTPVFENDMPIAYGAYDGQSYGAYHGYAATDLYNVDRRFGANADFKQLIDEAHGMDIKVIMDFIHNHVGDHHWWFKDPPQTDWFNRPTKFSITNYETVVASDPYASKYDLEHLTAAPFVEAMPDLNQNNPLLSRYLIQNTLWWIEYAGIDGIRMDTYPYAFKEHMATWAGKIMDQFPSFKIVGEVWAKYPPSVSYWQNGSENWDNYNSNLPSVIDFPFSSSVGDAFGHNSKPRMVREIYFTFARDWIYPEPMDNVIFLDNHDTNRFYMTVGRDLRKYKLGLVLLMVSRGVPQLYYGAEINLYGDRSKGGDADIRKDFPGGWPDDKRDAFTKKGRTDEENELWNFCSLLLNWRKNNSVIHKGKTMQFVPTDQHTYVLVRYDDSDAVCLIINPLGKDVVFDIGRISEIAGNAGQYFDVMDGKTKKLTKEIKIEPMGFRLIEFKL